MDNLKKFQNVSKCFKMFQNVSQKQELSEEKWYFPMSNCWPHKHASRTWQAEEINFFVGRSCTGVHLVYKKYGIPNMYQEVQIHAPTFTDLMNALFD
jgi:hypothetical protein